MSASGRWGFFSNLIVRAWTIEQTWFLLLVGIRGTIFFQSLPYSRIDSIKVSFSCGFHLSLCLPVHSVCYFSLYLIDYSDLVGKRAKTFFKSPSCKRIPSINFYYSSFVHSCLVDSELTSIDLTASGRFIPSCLHFLKLKYFDLVVLASFVPMYSAIFYQSLP